MDIKLNTNQPCSLAESAYNILRYLRKSCKKSEISLIIVVSLPGKFEVQRSHYSLLWREKKEEIQGT